MSTMAGNEMERKQQALRQAAEEGDLGDVQALLAEGLDPSYADEAGWSPLIMASKRGHDEVVKELLMCNAALNPGRTAHTALRAAAIYGHRSTIEILLAAKADPNVVSLHGRTPLMGAAMGGHSECARILLEGGANCEAQNDVGESAADLARLKQDTHVLEILQCASLMDKIRGGQDLRAEEIGQEKVSGVQRVCLHGKNLLDVAVECQNEAAAIALIIAGVARGTPNANTSMYNSEGAAERASELADTGVLINAGNARVTPNAKASSDRCEGAVQSASDLADTGVMGDSPRGSGESDRTACGVGLSGKTVLVIGGTQFMGRSTVEALVQEGCQVSIVTRGKSKNPHGDNVKHFICDRMANRERFKEIVASGRWDAIIDFVAFHKASAMDVVLALDGADTHYIFISTDSVYMACDAAALNVGCEGGVREEWGVRGREKECLARDAYQYEYGANKFAIEECLRKVQQSTGLKYTSLRLCDVMGPYDNIGVLLRLKAFISTQRPIPAGIKKGSLINPPLSEHRVSIVFSGDVVRCILATIRSGKKAFGQELNVAGAEQRTVREFVALLKEELGVDGEIIWEENVATLFPSVDFGPIDSTKARSILGWEPTPLREWIKETLKWYERPENAAYTMAYALRG